MDPDVCHIQDCSRGAYGEVVFSWEPRELGGLLAEGALVLCRPHMRTWNSYEPPPKPRLRVIHGGQFEVEE